MSADGIYSDDWNSSLTGSQINAWNLEDDITSIGSRAEDYLAGVWRAENCGLDAGSRWKKSNDGASDPFRRFQTPSPNRTSPTPLADLYSQSIDQAVVNSESWGETAQTDCSESSVEEETADSQSVNDVEFMPQDLFSFASARSSHETLNSSITGAQDDNSLEEKSSSLTEEESQEEYTPKLLVESTKKGTERQVKRPLLSLSVGMTICGVGLVFGSQIMQNTAAVNPGKSLIIAGLIGLFVSAVFQTVKKFGRRKAA